MLADFSNFNRDFLDNDGSRRLLEIATEMEEVFPTYDLSGQRITTVHSHYRRLAAACTPKFQKPDCKGSCKACSGKIATAKCKARQLKCKGATKGLSFPFMSNLPSLIGLFSGKDIELLEFRPPPFVFFFDRQYTVPILFFPPVNLVITFAVEATVEIALVLDTKGIREAVQEKRPEKALNSFAIRDIIDGVDSPLLTVEASVEAAVEVSAVIVVVGVSGGITFRFGELREQP